MKPVLACAVCFGAGDNPAIPRAFTWGILVLLGFTFLVLGAFAVSVYRLEARRNSLPHDQ